MLLIVEERGHVFIDVKLLSLQLAGPLTHSFKELFIDLITFYIVNFQIFFELELGVDVVHRVQHIFVNVRDFFDRLPQFFNLVREGVRPG